jgi:hypothetical protein
MIIFLIIAVSTKVYSQSTWDYIGLSRYEIVSNFGSGIEGENNSLVFIGPSNQEAIATGWTFHFNSRDKVKKVIFTSIHRTRYSAKMQLEAMQNVLVDNGFDSISETKYSNGTRTVTLSLKSENGLFALYTTCY